MSRSTSPATPRLAERLLAEGVDGGDRGRVEVGQRAGEVGAALLDLLARPLREQLHDLVAAGIGAGQERLQPGFHRDQALAHAVAELAGGDPREGDEQQLLQRRALGDVARGQRRDRVRLARPGARFQDGHARRERAADVERRCAAHASCTSSRSHRRRASRPNRVVSPVPQSSPAADGPGEQLVEREHAVERELVLGLDVLLVEVPLGLPLAARGVLRVALVAHGLRVGGGGCAGDRQRLAHAAVVEVGEDARAPRRRVLRTERRQLDHLHAARRRARRSRPRSARSGYAAQSATSRTQAPIRWRAPTREYADGAQHRPGHVRHRPAHAAPVVEHHAHVDRSRLRLARTRHDLLHDRPDLGDRHVRERAGRQLAARDLGGHGVVASTHRRAGRVSIRSPIRHRSRPSTSTGSASAGSVERSPTLTSSRWLRNAPTGLREEPREVLELQHRGRRAGQRRVQERARLRAVASPARGRPPASRGRSSTACRRRAGRARSCADRTAAAGA